MTSGSVLKDDRLPATGGGWWGIRYSNNWNGADRPKSTKSPHNTYTTYREYFDVASKTTKRKEFTFRIPDPAPTSQGWNRVPRRLYDEEHAFTRTLQRLFHDKVRYNVSSNFTFWDDMTTHGVTSWGPENLLTANHQIKLVGKLGDQLYGSDFNMGVFIGELGDTLGLIGSTATSLGLALGYAGRGQFGRAAEQLVSGTSRRPQRRHPNFSQKYWDEGKGVKETLASRWLELQYGWLPLLKDVEAAAHMLAHHLNVPARKSYRSKVHAELRQTRTTQVGFLPSQKAIGTAIKTHDRWLIARIEEKGSIPQMLGLTNPEMVAWELVPYSFVADWFIPIGDWMRARALVQGLKGTFITSDKRLGLAFSPTSKFFSSQPRGNFRWLEFNRSISTTIKVPMPTFKPLGSVASWQHCANAVGLLVSGFAGRGK